MLLKEKFLILNKRAGVCQVHTSSTALIAMLMSNFNLLSYSKHTQKKVSNFSNTSSIIKHQIDTMQEFSE